MAAVIRIVVVALALAAPATAAAAPRVPAAIEGVALPDDVVAIHVERGVKALGGRSVVAFSMITAEITEVAIVDRETKAYLVRATVAGDGFRYRIAWEDGNGDGEPDLVLHRVRGDGPEARAWTRRYGAIVEVPPDELGCAPPGDDDVALGGEVADATRRAAIARLVEALDVGAARTVVVCAYVDAIAAARIVAAPVPGRAEVLTAAPVAHDCPGLGWAARRGRALAPARTVVFRTADGHLAIVRARGDDLAARAVDLVADRPGVERIVWSERWVLDHRLWVLAEVAGAGRHAVAYDPAADEVRAVEPLAEGEVARVEHTTRETGRFALIISDGRNHRAIWAREVSSWRL